MALVEVKSKSSTVNKKNALDLKFESLGIEHYGTGATEHATCRYLLMSKNSQKE